MTWPDAFVTAIDHLCWTFIAWKFGGSFVRFLHGMMQ